MVLSAYSAETSEWAQVKLESPLPKGVLLTNQSGFVVFQTVPQLKTHDTTCRRLRGGSIGCNECREQVILKYSIEVIAHDQLVGFGWARGAVGTESFTVVRSIDFGRGVRDFDPNTGDAQIRAALLRITRGTSIKHLKGGTVSKKFRKTLREFCRSSDPV